MAKIKMVSTILEDVKLKVENYVESNVFKSEVAVYFDFCNPSLYMLPNIRLFHNWVIFYF